MPSYILGTLLLIAKEHKGGKWVSYFPCGSLHNNVHFVISHAIRTISVKKACWAVIKNKNNSPAVIRVIFEVHKHGSQHQIRYIRVPDLMY
jgi:hypothetical protein